LNKKDKVAIALQYARELIQSTGLDGWSVWSNDSYSTLAATYFGVNRIVFSKRYISIATKEDFRKTVFHEIAHAKLGYDVGHNKDFVKLCRELTPGEPYDEYCAYAPIHRYNLYCNVCGDSGQTNKTVKVFCESCPKNGRGVQEYTKIKNDLCVVEWASTQ